jgi:hypothetical protein
VLAHFLGDDGRPVGFVSIYYEGSHNHRNRNVR